jgi:hypothetical protein
VTAGTGATHGDRSTFDGSRFLAATNVIVGELRRTTGVSPARKPSLA